MLLDTSKMVSLKVYFKKLIVYLTACYLRSRWGRLATRALPRCLPPWAESRGWVSSGARTVGRGRSLGWRFSICIKNLQALHHCSIKILHVFYHRDFMSRHYWIASLSLGSTSTVHRCWAMPSSPQSPSALSLEIKVNTINDEYGQCHCAH